MSFAVFGELLSSGCSQMALHATGRLCTSPPVNMQHSGGIEPRVRFRYAQISLSLSPCWAHLHSSTPTWTLIHRLRRGQSFVDSDVDTASLNPLLVVVGTMFGLPERSLHVTGLFVSISQEKVIGGMKRRVKGGHLHETVEDVARHMG
jgi:hypothetical protein